MILKVKTPNTAAANNANLTGFLTIIFPNLRKFVNRNRSRYEFKRIKEHRCIEGRQIFELFCNLKKNVTLKLELTKLSEIHYTLLKSKKQTTNESSIFYPYLLHSRLPTVSLDAAMSDADLCLSPPPLFDLENRFTKILRGLGGLPLFLSIVLMGYSTMSSHFQLIQKKVRYSSAG